MDGATKRAGAIALTLIIIVPLMLGYALAFKSEDVTDWEEGETWTITDSLLNSETPYFRLYSSPANNSMLYESSGDELTPSSPDYASTSTRYTTTPVSTTTTETAAIPETSTTTYDITTFHTIGNIAPFSSSVAYVTSHPTMVITIPELQAIHASVTLEGIDARTAYQSVDDVPTQIYLGMTGGTPTAPVWTAWVTVAGGVQVIHDITGWQIVSDADGSVVSVRTADLASFAPSSASVWSASVAGTVAITNGSGTVYRASSSPMVVSDTNGLVTVAGETFAGATVQAADSRSGVWTYYISKSTGMYADVSYGWRIPHEGAWIWVNAQENDSIDLYIDIGRGASNQLRLIGVDDGTTATVRSSWIEISRDSAGMVSVNGTQLGAYEYLEAQISAASVTVSGLVAWPAMGTQATRMASSTVALTDGPELITGLQIGGSTNTVWRVDSTDILAGRYGSTKDATADIAGLFPQVKSCEITLNSLAVVGDYLTVAGSGYEITDGRISILDLDTESAFTIPVRGLVVRSIVQGDGSYAIYLDGHRVGSSDVPGGAMTFGGEWSVTATLTTLDQITKQKTSWVPGGFGFDKDSVLICALLVALAAFVAIGLAGRRSGVKAGMLILICGGASVVILTMF